MEANINNKNPDYIKEADSVIDKHIECSVLCRCSTNSDDNLNYAMEFDFKNAVKHSIQDRQSVLKEVEQAFKTTGVFHSQYWLNRIQSLTQQINYLKNKL